MNLYVSMRRFWIWALVDIPHHHDLNDHILFLHDEKTRNGLLGEAVSIALVMAVLELIEGGRYYQKAAIG